MPNFDAVVDMNENIQPNSGLIVRYTNDIKAKTLTVLTSLWL